MHSDLIKRLEAGECSNELDVLIECAFNPCRPNAAGTKVIYGNYKAYLARDWSLTPERRLETIAALRAQGGE